MRLTIAVVLLIILPHHVLGWGPAAYNLFCDETVSTVWGHGSLDCLKDKNAYCNEIKEHTGDEAYRRCSRADTVNPATAPADVFMDFQNQKNLDDCPLTFIRPTNEFICDGEGNAAGEMANYWFEISAKEDNICRQVRAFCTGAFYFASSRYSLNRVIHLDGCLGGTPEAEIDGKILVGEQGWTIEKQCIFSYQKEMAGRTKKTTQQVSFRFNDEDVQEVVDDLKAKAHDVSGGRYVPETTKKKTTTTQPPQTTSILTTTSTAAPQTTTTQELPSTTTVTAPATTHLQTTITAYRPTTTATDIVETTTTMRATTSTISVTTSTVVPPENVDKSIKEIESILDDIDAKENKNRQSKGLTDNILLVGVLTAIFIISAITLVSIFLKTRNIRVVGGRPKIILPPSVRNRGRRKKAI